MSTYYLTKSSTKQKTFWSASNGNANRFAKKDSALNKLYAVLRKLPETSIVNEPLAKIGTYAAELTTVPGITPQTGTNTLTVDTTLSPSSVSITGHIKETV